MTRENESCGHAVVIGGGLAGVRAALELADHGWRVTVLESRPRLGGAAYSFVRDGLSVDTGQHVLLRCYTEYLELVRRLGAEAMVPVQQRLDIPVLRRHLAPQRLRRTRHGIAPAHLAPSLMRYSALSVRERARAALAMAALRGVDPDDPANDRETFGGWLRGAGQSDAALSRLWGLIAVGALNINIDEASLALAARVFRTGLLERVRSGDLGIPAVPLGEIHDTATRRHLADVGVKVHDRERAVRIDRSEDSFLVRTADQDVPADAVVVAVPHRQASSLVPEAACPDRDRWAGLGSSAIVTVHIRYDRPVTDLRFAAVLDSPVQWLFDRTAAAQCSGQYLVMPMSGADAAREETVERLVTTHLDVLADVFPRARTARVVDSFVTREPHATFRQAAGTAHLRPPATTGMPGLVLAGAWTATGWPDTMEGAVRSGLTAARVLGSPLRATRERSVLSQ